MLFLLAILLLLLLFCILYCFDSEEIMPKRLFSQKIQTYIKCSLTIGTKNLNKFHARN